VKAAGVGFSEPSKTPNTGRFARIVEQLQERALAEPAAIPTDPKGRELADWTVRVVATCIDVVLLTGLQALGKQAHLGSLTLFLADWIVALGYLCFIAWKGVTVGNLVTKTKVVDEDSGEVLSLGRAVLRAASILGLLITLIGAGIDVLFPLIDGRRQTLHDKAGSSLVIRTGRIFALPGGKSLGDDHGT
jgi:uncharacterized RDD family membrane protein YckC